MSIKISGTDAIDDNRKGLFQSANVGTFTPENRPGSAATGDLIYNSSTAQMEVWNGSSWVRACGATEVAATGGNLTYDHNGNRVHIFSSPGTFSVSTGGVVEYVIVAGGGAGDIGGGGAGGVLTGYFTVSSGSYPITVGAGGAGGNTGGGAFPARTSWPTPGNPSSAFSQTAIGGGRGGGVAPPSQSDPITITLPGPSIWGGTYTRGNPGGSGGGGVTIVSTSVPPIPAPTRPQWIQGGAGTPGQGSPGGNGGISPGGSSGGGGGGGAGYFGNHSIYFQNPAAGNTYANSVGNHGYGISLVGWGIPSSYGDIGTNWGFPSDVTFFCGGGMYRDGEIRVSPISPALYSSTDFPNWIPSLPISVIGGRGKGGGGRGKPSPLRGRIMPKEHREKIGKSKEKTFYFIDPEGKLTKIKNLQKYCNDNNLARGYFYQLIRGEREEYRGWRMSK